MKRNLTRHMVADLQSDLSLSVSTVEQNGHTNNKTAALSNDISAWITELEDYRGSATRIVSDTYSEPTEKYLYWREGMVTGNGNNGVITSGSPYSDQLIFQNMYFLMPSGFTRVNPNYIQELFPTRQAVLKLDKSYILGDGRWRTYFYTYHPSHPLRLNMEEQTTISYERWTDFKTSEVGVNYTDINGSWERKTFTSREDDVTITQITESSSGKKVNMTVSIDNLSDIAGWQNDETRMQYKKIVNDNADYIALISHYPSFEDSELKNGGYAGLTQVVVIGGKKERIVKSTDSDSQNVGIDKEPQIQITNADAVYLITKSNRTHEMGELSAFKTADDYELLNELLNDTTAVVEKYTIDNKFDYNAALAPHEEKHGSQFNMVEFGLNANESDRKLSTEGLLNRQKILSDDLNNALIERAYYAGRYVELCCSGYSTPRLTGMWTGEWDPGWRGIYTMDANVNLQVAPMNTGNIADTPIGYINFILRQVKDWMDNAALSYGMHDAIQPSVNTDGDSAIGVESDQYYPFQYWNAGGSWLLLPIYEYWQCYGNQKIMITDAIDLYKIRTAMGVNDGGLSEAEVDDLMNCGYLDLEQDILLPLLIKQANFWEQLCTPEYFTDALGKHHYEEGKSSLNAGEKYLLIPTYSPENSPRGWTSTLTYNATMDISAARDGLMMAIALEKAVNRTGYETNIDKWENLIALLPDYEYDGEQGSAITETGGGGALREWATQSYLENNNHRHISHLYVAWPAYETQHDEKIYQGARQALANRDRLNTSDNTTGHGWMHRALISARLKDGDDVFKSLQTILSSDIYYNSMVTDHNTNRISNTYCTDTSIGLVGVINEALVFSNTGEIEILPALPDKWTSGYINGLMARTRAEVESLVWDTNKGFAVTQIRSDIDQTLSVTSGMKWIDAKITGDYTDYTVNKEKDIKITLKKDQIVTVIFYGKNADKKI